MTPSAASRASSSAKDGPRRSRRRKEAGSFWEVCIFGFRLLTSAATLSFSCEWIGEAFVGHESRVCEGVEESDNGRFLSPRQMQADLACGRRTFVVGLHDQGAQCTAVFYTAVVVIQHFLEGIETAVVHVGCGEGDV